MDPVSIIRGDSPIILGQPHSGTYIPQETLERLNERGRLLADTDWHIDKLYAGLTPNASVVRANFHRYVIDPNRDPAGGVLYADSNTTELVPTTDFDGEPIWILPPDAKDIAARTKAFHAPYHEAIAAEISRIKARHGFAVLFDCHSIRSHIPYLFDGTLPDLNIGTNSGASCAPELEAAVTAAGAGATRYSHVVNGRFKGGWTTRHYGRPEENTHAIQLELSQALYLESEEPPFNYDDAKAAPLRETLRDILTALTRAAQTLII